MIQLSPIEPPEEPVEPLPKDTAAAMEMIDKRAWHFARNYGAIKCHDCKNEDLSFAEPWAQCFECGWTEGD